MEYKEEADTKWCHNSLRQNSSIFHALLNIELVKHSLCQEYGIIMNTYQETILAIIILSMLEAIHKNAEDGTRKLKPKC